jgi:hypothetical protein
MTSVPNRCAADGGRSFWLVSLQLAQASPLTVRPSGAQ